MSRHFTTSALLILALLLSSCRGAGEQPMVTITQMVSPSSTTAVVLPTVTPVPPTHTAIPSPITPSSTATPTPGMGSKRLFPKDHMTQVFVPAGNFLMGTLSKDVDHFLGSIEEPQHSVMLTGYWIDQTEVTNRMFADFVDETNYITDAEKDGWGITLDDGQPGKIPGVDWKHPEGASTNLDGKDEHPVVQVSWNDANAYCAWAGRRLPTEAEWEKAARGTNALKFPWGDQAPDDTMLVFNKLSSGTSKVGSHPKDASPYGVLDMAGSVSEWVGDWYSDSYYKNSPQTNPQGPETGEKRVSRGGSFGHPARFLRVAIRWPADPKDRRGWEGFRCVDSEP